MSEAATARERTASGSRVGFTEFRAAVSQTVVPLDVRSDRPDSFGGFIESVGAGDIHILDVTADEHSVRRSEALIARGTTRYYKFSLILEGNALIVQEGRETALRTGDMAIYDADRPYSLVFADTVRMGIVMFPKELLELPADTVAALTARRLRGDSGIGAMVGPYLTQLVAQTDDLDRHLARRLARSAVDLVGTLLTEHADAHHATGAHEMIVRRVLEYIDDHLVSPDLSPARIAAAHYISVRHLHFLFSTRGTSVSTMIRTRRLERAYDDLINPSLADRAVSAIALDNGFVDPAHFSRTFRAHFGTSPSSLRPSIG